MFPISESYLLKSICLEPLPATNPNTKLNRKFDLTQIPQAIIDIANTYLTFREKALLRSSARYFNQTRHAEILDLLKEPLPHRVLSQDLFKHFTRIQQLYLSFEKDDDFPINFGTFLRNPKFATVSKLHIKNFFINELELMKPFSEAYKSIARNYLSTFQFSLIDLTVSGHAFDLNPLAPLVNLQRLKIEGYSIGIKLSSLNHLTKLTHFSLTNSLNANTDCLENLVNLTFLDLSNNPHLSRIVSLNKLTKLKYLNLAECKQIVNLEPLTPLCNLEYLNLSGINCSLNKRQTIDPTPITYMPYLQTLNLNFDNDYPDLRYLGHLSHLTQLTLNARIVTDFSPLLGLTKLRKLECRNTMIEDDAPRVIENDVSNYAPIFLISSLTELHLVGVLNQIPKIQLPQLKILNLSYNTFPDVQRLRYLTKLETLDLSHTLVSNWEPISRLVNLRHISTFPSSMGIELLSNLRNLKVCLRARLLSMDDGQDFLKLNNLEYLSMYLKPDAEISDLEPLLKLPRLKGLCLSQGNFTCNQGFEKNLMESFTPSDHFLQHPKLNALLKDNFIVNNNHQLFPILTSLGEYTNDS